MIRLIKNILTVAFAEISCKKFFFILSRQYVLHKFYNFAIMQALMMLRHHDIQENILELSHANLEENSISFSKDLLYEQEKRDQTMKNAIKRQYMNDNKNVDLNIIVSLIFICLN